MHASARPLHSTRRPRHLRAARVATRNGLSSMLRLARPLNAGAFDGQTMVQLPLAPLAGLVTPLFPSGR